LGHYDEGSSLSAEPSEFHVFCTHYGYDVVDAATPPRRHNLFDDRHRSPGHQ
jgi:hypothetical protein